LTPAALHVQSQRLRKRQKVADLNELLNFSYWVNKPILNYRKNLLK